MELIDAIVLTLCTAGILFCFYLIGYYTGRADGIKCTRDVYNGKRDDEIHKWSENENR